MARSTRIKILALLVFALLPFKSWAATTWYVRDGGGTATQCTGTTDAVYPGSGTAQPCALNHPAWVMGTTGTNGTTAGLWAGGDTMSVHGDSDNTPGTQAQYIVGFGMPNSPKCLVASEYFCIFNNVPAGVDSTHKTQIVGTGTNKPQFYSTLNAYQVLDSQVNHVNIQWLEITDHYECGLTAPNEPCPSLNGNPQFDGMVLSGDDVTMTDVYIHGLSRYGINGSGNFGNMTFTRVWVIGNSFGGWLMANDGSSQGTGTITLNQPIVEWTGCVEKYPMTSAGIDNPSNYQNCFGQNNGGYGDALGFGATGGQPAGNWTIIGPGSLSFNVQDGLDILHGISGTGTDQIDKMLFVGNGGQAIKVTGLTVNVTNSLIIGNCGWWYQSSQAASGDMQPGDSCRANGGTIVVPLTAGSSINLYNDTILTAGIALTTDDGSNNTCDGTTVINEKNDIIQGGYTWNDNSNFISGGGDSPTTNYYADGWNDTKFTVSGVTTWPAVGDTYTTQGHTWTVLRSPNSGSSGTIYFNEATGSNFGAGTLTRATGAGDATISYSAAQINGGNGDGPCGQPGNGTGGLVNPTEDYNIIYGNKNSNAVCGGAHDKCGTVPKFTSGNTFPLGTLSGPLSSYYQGFTPQTLVAIDNTSNAAGTGVTGLTYWNTGTDYYSVTRANPPSMGAEEVSSCAANAYLCFVNADCCTSTCTNNACANAVVSPGSKNMGGLFRLTGSFSMK